MKRRNGFTLIELLAIIVILAIIAVITVPLILDIIDNAKEKSVIDSAYGYKSAINQYYVSKMMADNSYEVKDDEYEISIYKSDGLTVSGEEPKDGWVKVVNGTVTDFSFLIGDYVVTYNAETNSIEAVKGTEPALTPTMQIKKEAKEAATEVSNYITALLSDSTISAYTKDTGKKVSEISTPTAPTGIDSNSWIFFKKETSVTAPDYSIKITKHI